MPPHCLLPPPCPDTNIKHLNHRYLRNAVLVTGSLPVNTVGGVAYILIRETDGKVVAVWHEK
jgi:hypothetical protein